MDKRTKGYRKFNNDKDILNNARDRYKIMAEDDRHNRIDALEDIRFVNLPGAQWSENMKTDRGNRPCYEYNKTRIRCKRVVNEMRDNRPSGKVRGVEGGDVEIAEIYEGLIRNIANTSHMDNATDQAAEFQVEGGMGCWRIDTEYSSDTAFEQDIVVRGIENPFSLYCDPSAKDFCARDARDWMLTIRMTHPEFEEKYGEAAKVDFQSDNEFEDDHDDEWTDEDTVRVAEFWYKKPVTKEIWQVEVPDGNAQPEPQTGQQPTKLLVVDSTSDEARGIPKEAIKNTREVNTHDIMMVVVSGEEILEGPVKWAGSKFPFIMIYGERKVIEGRTYWWGLTRFAKDAQRNFNVSKTAIAETIAQAPKAKWWATSKQAAGHTDEWAEADRKNFPYLLYEADPQAGGSPARMGGADVPVALMQQSQMDNEDLKDVMGLPDASMGAEGQEKSGRAIYARQQQGAIATFNYQDNMAKGVEYTYELLIDLIPEIYDTERELRVLGVDGSETYKKINQMVMDPETGKAVRINDMAAGKYDVTVTTGPAFSTQRQEAAEMYMQLTQGAPEIMQIAGDLILKSIDLPYSDEIAERLKAMLPPQIQQSMQEDGQDIPPEVMQAMQQAEQAMQQAQEYGQLVQAASQELEGEKAEDKVVKAGIQTDLANLEKAKAEFDTHIARETAGMIERESGMTTKAAEISLKGAELKEKAASAGAEEVRQYTDAVVAARDVQKIDDVLANFMGQVDQAVGGISEKSKQLETMATRKVVGGNTSREGGKLVANVQYDDGSERSLSAVRENGGLTIEPE
jgi:hypothetical protein